MASTPTTTPHEQTSTVTGSLHSSLSFPHLSLPPRSLGSDKCSAFAKDLQDLISSTTASSNPLAIPDNTLRTLDTHLSQLPLSRTALTTSTRQQLDTKGTELWNTCLQVVGTCGEGGVCGLLSKGLSGSKGVFLLVI